MVFVIAQELQLLSLPLACLRVKGVGGRWDCSASSLTAARAAAHRAASPARPEPAQQPAPPPPPPPAPAAPEPEPVAAMSEEETARRAKGLAAEFFNNGDAEEIRISIRVSICCPGLCAQRVCHQRTASYSGPGRLPPNNEQVCSRHGVLCMSRISRQPRQTWRCLWTASTSRPMRSGG